MELRQLQYFIAVAEELHFGHAAVREKVAPSAVSEQIRRLERELGVSLLERTSRKVRLTEAGRLFVDEIKPTLSALDKAGDLARRAGRGEFGTLKVGFVSTAAYDLTTEILRGFRQRYPGITVELKESPLSDPYAGVRDGTVDAAFVRLPVAPDERVMTHPLLTEQCVLAVASDHPLATRPRVDYRMLDSDARIPAMVTIAGGGISIRPGRRANAPSALNTVGEMLESVVLGTAIGIVPRSYALCYRRPGLKYVPLLNGPISQVALAWRKQQHHPTLMPFVTLCQRMAKMAPGTGDRRVTIPQARPEPARPESARPEPAHTQPAHAESARPSGAANGNGVNSGVANASVPHGATPSAGNGTPATANSAVAKTGSESPAVANAAGHRYAARTPLLAGSE